jgi:dihydrofolate reductase
MDTNKTKVHVFMNISLDGYFTDSHNDMHWAYTSPNDKEWKDFVSGNASGGGTLLFGRVTYQMMESFWPTPMAVEQMPVVAERMNACPKIVFSTTLDSAGWSNTTLIKGDLINEVKKLKATSGETITILGSGNIVAQLAEAGLIDEFAVVVVPVALGSGRTMFDGITQKLSLKLTKSRVFGNGNTFLTYQPA